MEPTITEEIPPQGQSLASSGQLLLAMARRHWVLALLVIAAFATRYWRLWEPDQVVFDEVHFGSFASYYFTGEYFFDIHPPLGKLIIAAAGWIGGFEPGFTFEHIGQPYGDAVYLPLRATPALFGVLLVPVIYLIVKQLGGSNRAATLGASLVLLDNAILVESRFILVDSMMLFFGFLSLALFLAMRRRPVGSPGWLILLLLTGLALGATVSTKWTGLGMMGAVLLAALADLIIAREGLARRLVFKVGGYGLALVILPAAIYYGVWILHFDLLPKSGPGDVYMSPEFRNSLEGANTTSEESLNDFEKVVEVNHRMYTSNSGLRATHPWQSEWWSWPFLPRGVNYWESVQDDQTARVYLLGVPYSWWLVLLGVLTFIFMAARSLIKRTWREAGQRRFLIVGGLLLAAVLANWLPFAPIKRPLFLYHYFFSFIFSILLASLVFDQVWARFGGLLHFRVISVAAISLVVVGFLLFTPLSYGYAIPNDLERLWIWFPSWQGVITQ